MKNLKVLANVRELFRNSKNISHFFLINWKIETNARFLWKYLQKTKIDELAKSTQRKRVTKIARKRSHDLRKVRSRQLDLNTTNSTHRNKNEDFLLVKKLDERTRNFFYKNSKILRIAKTEILKRLTILVTNSTKLYFVIFEVTKFTKSKNELNKTTKSRILTQINEISINLFEYREILFFTENFNFHIKRSRSSNNFRCLTKSLTTVSKKNENKTQKILSSMI